MKIFTVYIAVTTSRVSSRTPNAFGVRDLTNAVLITQVSLCHL
jgi:hypothetical protein